MTQTLWEYYLRGYFTDDFGADWSKVTANKNMGKHIFQHISANNADNQSFYRLEKYYLYHIISYHIICAFTWVCWSTVLGHMDWLSGCNQVNILSPNQLQWVCHIKVVQWEDTQVTVSSLESSDEVEQLAKPKAGAC